MAEYLPSKQMTRVRIPIGAYIQVKNMNKDNIKQKVSSFHDKNYKLLLLLPAVLLLFCIFYMVYFYSANNDFFYKDISLTGGTSVTINNAVNAQELSQALSSKLEGLNVREISDLITKKQIALIVETTSDEKITKTVLEEYLGYSLTEENSSFEFTSATLSDTFYQQLMIAIIVAFVLMSLVVFSQFRSFIPSMAVILSAFADIIFALVTINLLKVPLSTAGIVAFLMLIGYSVDTDILLTNKVLKKEGKSINFQIWASFKTGITMTLTSIFAVLAAFLIVGSFSSTLHQIFLIMLLGLFADIFNTWWTNVCIIKWYAINLHKKREAKNNPVVENKIEVKNEN